MKKAHVKELKAAIKQQKEGHRILVQRRKTGDMKTTAAKLEKLVATGPKVPVMARALIQRINRNLLQDDKRVMKARGRAVQELGEYYTVDLYSNGVTDKNVALETLGRTLGVLHAYETLKG